MYYVVGIRSCVTLNFPDESESLKEFGVEINLLKLWMDENGLYSIVQRV